MKGCRECVKRTVSLARAQSDLAGFARKCARSDTPRLREQIAEAKENVRRSQEWFDTPHEHDQRLITEHHTIRRAG